MFETGLPVIQGAMAGIADADFVVAVARCGVLPTLATYGLTPRQLRQALHHIHTRTKRSFAVNLMLQQPNWQELAQVLLAEKITIVSLSAGYQPELVWQLHQANVQVLAVVGSLRQALKMAAQPVDYLVLEGNEAGGHVGTTQRATLLAQVRPVVQQPLIVAGGIYQAQQLQTALHQGAIGVQMGTRFLLSQEANLPLVIQQRLLGQQVPIQPTQPALRGLKISGRLIPCGSAAAHIYTIQSLASIMAPFKAIKNSP